MSTHTPSPWEVDAYGDVQSNGEDVARIASESGYAKADARLIAASPSMLHALQTLVTRSRNIDTGNLLLDEDDLLELENVVSKAGGVLK